MTTLHPNLIVNKMHPDAQLPLRGSKDAAGLDLFAHCIDNGSLTIPSRSRKLVNTNIRMIIPHGYYGRIAPRSGLSCKGIDIGAGVIDTDYRGHVRVLMINNSDNDYEVQDGHKIAQLIIEKISMGDVQEVNDEEYENHSTERGEGGFGSTGY